MSFREWVTKHKVAVGIGAVVAAVVVVAVVLVVVFTTMDNSSEKPWETEIRLPKTVIPVSYDLFLHPNLDTGTFSGSEDIQLEINEDRNYLVFHAKYLSITDVFLKKESGNDHVAIHPLLEVPKAEWWVVRSSDGVISAGKYILHIEFSGSLTRNIVGFYRSVHTTAAGESRYIATTKFEPTYARLAFPCFDEPAMKATFSVRLVRPSGAGYVSLSNTDVESESPGPSAGLTTVKFNTSVKMSTYLAAFIVCDFVRQKENVTTEENVLVNVYARAEQINNTKVALDTAVQALNIYVKFFKISYPMPKVDLIAIPDFVSGAMENWGLITFRETQFLFDPAENSPANQQSVCITVAHELAHMWFGNLVTMAWWTDLWLNEGFATFMAYKSVDQIHKDWEMLATFAIDTLEPVLKLDAVISSHPILQVVTNPDQITEVFDSISYDKGSSLIRMLEAFMKEDNFANGLNYYLNQHKYSNAETVDLWNALQMYAPKGVNVSRVMNTWTLQTGFPVVTVKQESAGKYVISQKRFLADKSASYDPSDSPYRYKWEIPILFSTSKSTNHEIQWLSSDVNSATISVDTDTEWIKLNYLQKGYYRVKYDEQGWKALTAALLKDVKVMEPVDRASLFLDAFSLAAAQEVEYEIPLDLTRYLAKENDFIPWFAASDNIKELLSYLPQSADLKKYGRSLLQSVYNDIGWEVKQSDSYLTRRLRGIVLDLMCSLELDSALKQANDLFVSWLNDGVQPANDVKSVMFRYGSKSDSSELWHKLLQKYQAETNAQVKVTIMLSLAQTTNEQLLKEYIELAKNESIIRSQDYFSALSYISANPKGTQLVWDFYRNEYDYLLNRFSLNDRVFGRFIRSVTKRFNTAEQLQEIKDFFSKNPESGAGTAARKQALEMVSNNINWISTHKATVEKWLNSAVDSLN